MDERKPKLIFIDGTWAIVRRVPAKAYGTTGADIWEDPADESWVCRVGQELAVHDLPPTPVGLVTTPSKL